MCGCSTRQIDVGNSFSPPVWHEDGSWSNLLGTDKLGRDVLSRLIYGARVSLTLSLLIIFIGGGAGTFLGILSGYLGKTADAVLQRFVELILALPTILVALVFVFTFGTSFTSVMFVLVPFLAARFIRIIRGETLTVRERDYVAIAQVIGSPTYRILWRHILPNVFRNYLKLGIQIIVNERGLSVGLFQGMGGGESCWKGNRYLLFGMFRTTFGNESNR